MAEFSTTVCTRVENQFSIPRVTSTPKNSATITAGATAARAKSVTNRRCRRAPASVDWALNRLQTRQPMIAANDEAENNWGDGYNGYGYGNGYGNGYGRGYGRGSMRGKACFTMDARGMTDDMFGGNGWGNNGWGNNYNGWGAPWRRGWW